MGNIGQARGFLFFRIVNKFFFRKRKKKQKLPGMYDVCAYFQNSKICNYRDKCEQWFTACIYNPTVVSISDSQSTRLLHTITRANWLPV